MGFVSPKCSNILSHTTSYSHIGCRGGVCLCSQSKWFANGVIDLLRNTLELFWNFSRREDDSVMSWI